MVTKGSFFSTLRGLTLLKGQDYSEVVGFTL